MPLATDPPFVNTSYPDPLNEVAVNSGAIGEVDAMQLGVVRLPPVAAAITYMKYVVFAATIPLSSAFMPFVVLPIFIWQGAVSWMMVVLVLSAAEPGET